MTSEHTTTIARRHSHALYNPGLLTGEELDAIWLGREGVLRRLLDDADAAGRGSSVQHHLVTGPRGMGKTTLLHRVGHLLDQRRGPALALRFPEEQWEVARLSDLWASCLDALAGAVEARGEDPAPIDALIAGLPTDEDRREEEARQALLGEAAKRSTLLVLLLDNLDIIHDRLTPDERWGLRRTLSDGSPLVIIGATATTDLGTDPKGAFFEFFREQALPPFSLEEAKSMIGKLAAARNQPEVTERIAAEPGHFEALHALSGGGPRALAMLYEVLTVGGADGVAAEFDRLLDLCTPLYKARFEELPDQARQVLAALASAFDPATAHELAASARLDVNAVSSQLARLRKGGWVEVVDRGDSARAAYQVAERLWALWYLMRAGRRSQRRLRWLVEFLGRFYGPDGLRAQAERLASAPLDATTETLAALSEAVGEEGWKRLLGSELVRRGDAGEECPPSTAAEAIRERRALRTEVERLLAQVPPWLPDREQFGERLLASPVLSWREKRDLLAAGDVERIVGVAAWLGSFERLALSPLSDLARSDLMNGLWDGYMDGAPPSLLRGAAKGTLEPDGATLSPAQRHTARTSAALLFMRASAKLLEVPLVEALLRSVTAELDGPAGQAALWSAHDALGDHPAIHAHVRSLDPATRRHLGDLLAFSGRGRSASRILRELWQEHPPMPDEGLAVVWMAARGYPAEAQALADEFPDRTDGSVLALLAACTAGNADALYALAPERRKPLIQLFRQLRPDLPWQHPSRRR